MGYPSGTRRGREKFSRGMDVLKKEMLGVSERSYHIELKEGSKEGSCEPKDGTAWDRRLKEVIERNLHTDAMRSRVEDVQRKKRNWTRKRQPEELIERADIKAIGRGTENAKGACRKMVLEISLRNGPKD